jgi:hypothetical protein
MIVLQTKAYALWPTTSGFVFAISTNVVDIKTWHAPNYSTQDINLQLKIASHVLMYENENYV